MRKNKKLVSFAQQCARSRAELRRQVQQARNNEEKRKQGKRTENGQPPK